MANCPKCGSARFHYELRAAGTNSRASHYRHRTGNSWLIPSGRRSYTSTRKRVSVGICPDCGYVREKQAAGSPLEVVLGWVVIIAIVSFGFRACGNEQSSTNSKNVGAFQQTAEKEKDMIWAHTYTPLEEFDYYIDHDKIYIKDYKGKNSKVYIAPNYVVDSISIPVIELESVFTLDRISSAIIPEGVTKMENNIFNSCGVEYIYLPSTLSVFDGWGYFYDVERLYYGGSEEQFKLICSDERSRIDVKRIVYDASIEDILKSEQHETIVSEGHD